MIAASIAAAICANVDAFWERRKSFDDFDDEQIRLWKRAEAAGVVAEVSAMLPVNQRN